MKDDYSTNSHCILKYISLSKVGKMYLMNSLDMKGLKKETRCCPSPACCCKPCLGLQDLWRLFFYDECPNDFKWKTEQFKLQSRPLLQNEVDNRNEKKKTAVTG